MAKQLKTKLVEVRSEMRGMAQVMQSDLEAMHDDSMGAMAGKQDALTPQTAAAYTSRPVSTAYTGITTLAALTSNGCAKVADLNDVRLAVEGQRVELESIRAALIALGLRV